MEEGGVGGIWGGRGIGRRREGVVCRREGKEEEEEKGKGRRKGGRVGGEKKGEKVGGEK